MTSEVEATTGTMRDPPAQLWVLGEPIGGPLLPARQLVWQLLKLGLPQKETEHSSKPRVLSCLTGSTEIFAALCLIHMFFD